MKLTGENRRTRGKTVPVPLCTPQITHELSRDRTRASAVGGRRLTASAMARPSGFGVYTDLCPYLSNKEARSQQRLQ
jgi:hypothetical protein